MSNDFEFDVAAKDIMDQIVVIRDPQLVITIERWMTKLTTEDRGPNELNYLKLLQYMMINRRIGSPFVRDPPAGMLMPLSRYLNPPPCTGPRVRETRSWRRTTKHSRAAQTPEFADEELESEGEYDDSSPPNNSDENSDVAVTSASASDTNAEETDASRGGAVAADVKNDGEDNDDGAGNIDKRDGHLAGGGECCDSRRKSKVADGTPKNCSNKNPFAKLCNPCLDGLGQHLRKRPEPLDVAYGELLGDCAIPTLTEAEAKTVSPELLRVLKNVNDTTTLQDFYFQVSLYTCDQASLLMRVSDGMMDDFRAFVMDVFESRAEHISDGLAKEQISLCVKYAYLSHRAFNRATVALDFLREAVPTFNWHKYCADPDLHMRWAILRRPPGTSASGDGDDDDAEASCPSRQQKTIAVGDAAFESNQQGGGGGGGGGVGDGDDEGDDNISAQQSAIKKLLYSLNWLRTEVMRSDCEFHRLFEQQKGLNACLAEANNRLLADRCRMNDEINRLKNEHTLLRQQSVDQTETIDRLMDAIQMAMQNKKSPTNTFVNC